MTTTRIKLGGNDARVKELKALVERDPFNVNQRFMLASALESDGKINDAVKRKAIKDFVQWMLGPGQNMVEALSYARLPKEVVAVENKTLAKIQ